MYLARFLYKKANSTEVYFEEEIQARLGTSIGVVAPSGDVATMYVICGNLGCRLIIKIEPHGL